MKKISRFCLLLLISSFLFSCSSYYKKRQEQREKVAVTSGLFCEFVSGDEYTDVDVEMNLRMAKRCDVSKPMNITNYKNASDNSGIVYCCQLSKNSISRKSEKTHSPSTDELSIDAAVENASVTSEPVVESIKTRRTNGVRSSPNVRSTMTSPVVPAQPASTLDSARVPANNSNANTPSPEKKNPSGTLPTPSSLPELETLE